MPRCEGYKRNDNPVVFSQGDMWLCPACIDFRFGQLTDQRVNRRRDSDVTERKQLAVNQDEEMPCSQNEADDNRQSATTPNEEDNIPEVSVINPLLAYMLFALQSGDCPLSIKRRIER